MAKDHEDNVSDDVHDEENTASSMYRPPVPKSVKEILETDPEDESLRRYKEALLGKAAASTNIIVDEKDPRIVILKSISLVSAGRDDVVLNFGAKLEDSSISFKIKEGVQYRMKFQFYVQREMVTGLRYTHKVTKMGVPVINERLMVGSYAPKSELIEYTTPPEEAPSGMLARGKYKVASKFSDDYDTVFAKWNWTIEISKEW